MNILETLVNFIPGVVISSFLFIAAVYVKKNKPHKQDNRRLYLIFLVMACLTLLCGVVAEIINNDIVYLCSLLIPVLFAVLCTILSYAKSAAEKTIMFIITFLIGIIMLVSLSPIFVNSTSDLDVVVTDESLTVNGSYGEEFHFTDVRFVGLVTDLPEIKIRTNGYSFNGVKLGRFKAKGDEDVLLYLYSRRSPFIMIVTVDDRTVFLNSKDIQQTREVYGLAYECWRKSMTRNSPE